MKMAVDRYLSHHFKYLGLSGDDKTFYTDSVDRYTMHAVLKFKISVNPLDEVSSSPCYPKIWMASLYEGLRASELVKDITSKLEKELKETQLLLAARDAEIQELSRYKAHFDIQMKLNHGDSYGKDSEKQD